MKVFSAIALISLAVSTNGAAQLTAADAAAKFGAREAIYDASLSPDGGNVAYIAPQQGMGSALFAAPIGGTPKRVLVASGNPERLEWCRWSSNTRLVCAIYLVQFTGEYGVLSASRLISVSSDGSNVKLLSKREGVNALGTSFGGGAVIDWLPGEDGAILMGRNYVPEGKVGSIIEKTEQGYGVDRVDTTTLAAKNVENPRRDAVSYLSDGRGVIRVMALGSQDFDGYTRKDIKYLFRRKNGREWETLSTYDMKTDEGFQPVAVDPDEDVVYGFRKAKGRLAVFKRALDGTNSETLVYANPDVDVDGLIQIGKARRVVGVSYATDRRRSVYFDKALADQAAKLGKLFGASTLVDFVDSSVDGQKLLVRVSADLNPGRYYLFDRTAKKLGELFAERPQLAGVALATVKSVSVKASDGTTIPAYLTLPPGSDGKNLAAIVLPHGGPSARDEWGFDWLSQFYANQGFAVLQPNYRGSAGYGDDWLQINGFKSWRTAIGDVADSGRWLVSNGIADPKRLAIVGWSYGGYAALQAAVTAPDLFKAVVAIAPVTDFGELKRQYRNFSSKYLADDYVGTGPHVIEGSPAQNVKAITAPVLMFHGTLDLNVSIAHARLMENKLKAAGKSVELVIFENQDHYLQDSDVRSQMLSKSAAFLKGQMGMTVN